MSLQKITHNIVARFPVLWNTRFYIFFPLLLVLNGLFFLGGLSYNTAPEWISYDFGQTDGSTVFFIVILELLLLIVWLFLYFRNNGLKSLYPKSRLQLTGEFIQVFFTCLLFCSFHWSYQYGIDVKINKTFPAAVIEKETRTINTARAFLPFSYQEYFKDGFCLDTPALEVVEPATPVAPADIATIADSIIAAPAIDNTQEEYTDAKKSASPLYSYRYYCADDYYYYNAKMKHTVKENVNRWLSQGNRDSVEQVLKEYLLIADKFKKEYRLNVDNRVKQIFKDSNFFVGPLLSTEKEWNNPESTQEYVPDLFRTYQNILNQLDRRNDYAIFYLVTIYVALGITMAIFSYRMTDRRSWFTALIYSIIWAILTGLILATGINEPNGVLILLIFLYTVHLGTGIIVTLNNTLKRVGGICISIAWWGITALLPLIAGLISSSSWRYYPYEEHKDSAAYKLTQWLQDHYILANSINFIFVLLVTIFVLIPLSKRWQANASE